MMGERWLTVIGVEEVLVLLKYISASGCELLIHWSNARLYYILRRGAGWSVQFSSSWNQR